MKDQGVRYRIFESIKKKKLEEVPLQITMVCCLEADWVRRNYRIYHVKIKRKTKR